MEMDPAQFEQLIRVLGTEPETNFFTAANITAITSVFIAFILFVIAFRQRIVEKRSRDAEFIFKSERDYGELFESLVFVGNWEKEPGIKEKLALIDGSSCPKDAEAILSAIDVPEEVWEHARRIKTHFKSIWKFYTQRIISRSAVELTLDHWGFRLLVGTIQKLEVHRFCYARRTAPERINAAEFQDDLSWYDELLKIKKLKRA